MQALLNFKQFVKRLLPFGKRGFPARANASAAVDSTLTVDELPVVPVHGNDLRLRIDQWDSLDLLKQTFEPSEVKLVKQLVKPGQTVLDVGANIGYYTLLFSRLVQTSGQVVAFEPDPQNAAILHRNLDENGCGNVSLHQVAVGDRAATTRLFRCDGNGGMHRLYDSICCSEKYVEVSTVVLDSVLAATPRIDFIKMDIEGYEYFALQGMRSILTKHAPTLMTEFSPFALAETGVTATAMIQFFADQGYTISSIGDNLVPQDYDDLFARAAVFDAHAGDLLARSRCNSLAEFSSYLTASFDEMGRPFEILDSWLCEKEAPLNANIG